MVADLIDGVERRWNREFVFQHLQQIDAHAIMNIHSSSISSEDCWAWQYEWFGSFTVRSAYWMLVETKRRREDWLEGRCGCFDRKANKTQWCGLWGAKIPTKLKLFAWRLARNSISIEEVRFQRHIAVSNISIFARPVTGPRTAGSMLL